MEPLEHPESLGHYDSILVPDVTILSNIVIVPRLQWEFSRELWATVQADGAGARVSGRYGFALTSLNAIFCLTILAAFLSIFMIIGGSADIKTATMVIGAGMAGPIIFDLLTRSFVKSRYRDFVTYLEYISKDGAVHPAR